MFIQSLDTFDFLCGSQLKYLATTQYTSITLCGQNKSREIQNRDAKFFKSCHIILTLSLILLVLATSDRTI